MKIYVDNREKKNIKKEPIVDKFKTFVASNKCELITEVVVGSYKSGDVHSGDGMVGIERKGDDFLPSVWSGQLEKQLWELQENFKYPFLFLEFDGIKDMITQCVGVSPKVVVGVLTSIMARHRVTVMFVGDLYVPFTCRVLEKFYDGKTEIKRSAYTPIRRKPTTKEIKRAMFEHNFPGLGSKKVDKLLIHFENSVGNIVRASVEELMEVPGIGKVLAEEIYEVLK